MERALDLVGAHCDLEKRLGDIPPKAHGRGIWIRAFEEALTENGKIDRYLEIFGKRASIWTWVPAGEACARLAVAGALYASPRELHVGIRTIGRRTATTFSESVLGRALIRVLAPDPVRVLKQGAIARRQNCDYGEWTFDFSEPRHATVRFEREYIWLEWQVLGSAEGTLAAIGVPASFELQVSDPYNGVLEISW